MTSSIKDECPAFTGQDGCPYKTIDDATVALAKKCPAFRDGCPFKGAGDVDTIGKMLEAVPESHLVGGQVMGSAKALYDLLLSVHDVSQQKKAEVGECPVFSTSCPFKNTVTSSGAPLVSELEYRTWAVFTDPDEEEEAARLQQQANSEKKKKKRNAAAAGGGDGGDGGVELSKHLKVGTKKSHRAAENVSFVRKFIKGKIDKRVYKKMVVSLWHTYKTLETELRRHKDHEVYGPLHFPKELERVPTLEEDLAYYYGPKWQELPEITAAPSPCTQDYVDRIKEVSATAPELLVAHAYTRYLGDLSGGQTLMRVATKAMGLPKDGAGTAFYRFEHVPSAKDFKNMYRAKLDEVGVGVELADRIVAEANLAFVLNMRTFEELDVLAGDKDTVRPLDEVLATLEMPVKEGQKCPFAAFGGILGRPAGHGHGGHGGGSTSKKSSSKKNKTAQQQQQQQQDGLAESGGRCPFPFILLHHPTSVLTNPKSLLTDMGFWATLIFLIAVLSSEAMMGVDKGAAGGLA